MNEKVELDIWLGLEIFLSFSAARLDLGPALSPIEWVSKHFSPKLNGQSVIRTIHSHLVSRLRMHGTACSLTQLLN